MRFTLEIVGQDKAVLGRRDLYVGAEGQLWSHVVAAARRIKDPTGVRLRVIDDAGGILVLTSATGALLVEAREAA